MSFAVNSFQTTTTTTTCSDASSGPRQQRSKITPVTESKPLHEQETKRNVTAASQTIPKVPTAQQNPWCGKAIFDSRIVNDKLDVRGGDDATSAATIVSMVCCCLRRRLERGAKLATSLAPFHTRDPPISITDYVYRLVKFGPVPPAILIVALVHFGRLEKSGLVIGRHTIHRLLLATLLLSAKNYDDNHGNNAWWARCGGISTSELNKLEVLTFEMLGWSIMVSTDHFLAIYKQISHESAHVECMQSDRAKKTGVSDCGAVGISHFEARAKK